MHLDPVFYVTSFERLMQARDLPPARIEWHPRLGSTNPALADRVANDPAGWANFSILGTDFQTAGQGRLGRTWTVQPGRALTFSTVFRFPSHVPTEQFGWVPLLTGWAVAEALRTLGVPATVKWPNDVLVADKKICGILCRLVPSTQGIPPAVIIGVGINVATPREDLPVDTATSLSVEGVDCDRVSLLAAVMTRMQNNLPELFAAASPENSEQAARIRAAMSTLGGEVSAQLPDGTTVAGTATGLTAHGDLIVATACGSQTVSAGDVIHVRRS